MSKRKLALYGGKPAIEKPLSGFEAFWASAGAYLGEEEKKAVSETIDEKLAGSPRKPTSRVVRFEKEFSEYMGVKHALGVTSGTSALCVALAGIGVGPGDEVIVPAYTWWSTATSVVASRAIPVIAEVDKSLTLDPGDFEDKITEYTKAVIPVHMRGAGCRMDEIMRIAKKHDLKVVEDVAQACGGSYKGNKLGTLGDAGAFSLQWYKIITCGEGGVVVTNDEEIHERCSMFHNSAYKVDNFAHSTNYRIAEILGACAFEQLKKIDMALAKMRKNKALLKKKIAGITGIEFRDIPDPTGDTGICLVFFLPTAEKTQEFANALRAENVSAGVMYVRGRPDLHVYSSWNGILHKRTITSEGCPFTCPLYRGRVEYSEAMCPNTLDILGRAIHIDVSSLMTGEHMEQVGDAINKVAEALL